MECPQPIVQEVEVNSTNSVLKEYTERGYKMEDPTGSTSALISTYIGDQEYKIQLNLADVSKPDIMNNLAVLFFNRHTEELGGDALRSLYGEYYDDVISILRDVLAKSGGSLTAAKDILYDSINTLQSTATYQDGGDLDVYNRLIRLDVESFIQDLFSESDFMSLFHEGDTPLSYPEKALARKKNEEQGIIANCTSKLAGLKEAFNGADLKLASEQLEIMTRLTDHDRFNFIGLSEIEDTTHTETYVYESLRISFSVYSPPSGSIDEKGEVMNPGLNSLIKISDNDNLLSGEYLNFSQFRDRFSILLF